MRWLIPFSDIHSGHKLGLLNPATVLEEEDQQGDVRAWTPKLGAYQEYLWALFMRNAEAAATTIGEDRAVVICNGDVTQGMRYQDLWVSTRLSDQIEIAVWNLQALLEAVPQVDVLRICVGTPSHEFGMGSAPRLVAKQLAVMFPKVDIKVVSHGLLDIDGVTVDYAHHGPGASRRHWLEGNEARFYLRDIMQREIKAGRPVPRLVVRSHVHTYVRETLRDEDRGKRVISDLLVTPAWCGMGDFAVQVTRSNYIVRHGLVLLGLEQGALRTEISMIETNDVRTKEIV